MCEADLNEKRPEFIMVPSTGLNGIVVSATPSPTVSSVRSHIASQSQKISVVSCS